MTLPIAFQLSVWPESVTVGAVVVTTGGGTTGYAIEACGAHALPETLARTLNATVLPGTAAGVVEVLLTIEYWSARPGTLRTKT